MDNGKNDMKIIITGASGFVGSRVYSKLLDEGHELIPFVQEPVGLENEIIIDFNDINFVTRINELPKADAIIHIGSKIGWYGASLQELYVPNVLVTSELANIASRMKALFVFTSAAIVHGVKTPHITSETVINPDTDYGYSKWLAEKMIQMSGVEYLILRMAGVFGKDGPPHLGINNAIHDVIKGNAPKLKGEGLTKRNYVYAEDLADMISDALQKKILGIHLVAGPEPITIKQMLNEICQVFISGQQPKNSPSETQGNDQIVEHSKALLKGRKYLNALYDIKSKIK